MKKFRLEPINISMRKIDIYDRREGDGSMSKAYHSLTEEQRLDFAEKKRAYLYEERV